MQNVSRNDPCPCGSGKKYKKCCLLNQQPTSTDHAWRQVHEAHLKLVHKLMVFTASTYGPIGYNEAWNEFQFWKNKDSFDPKSDLHPMFGPWMFYHWNPDRHDTELGEDIPMKLTPAEAFIEAMGHKLSDLEIEDLEENLRRPFSFYDVLECSPGFWVKVQDLFTEERFTVVEKMGSKSMKAGDLLFGKVVTVREICMFDGLAPFVTPPQYKVNVINERKRFKKKAGSITAAWLRENEPELRNLFWNFYEALFNPKPPILCNTDGDLMAPHKMTFTINDIEETFEALHNLCFNGTREELLAGADYDKHGKIKAVDFPWLRKGHKQNRSLDNTVLGHIYLEHREMTVEVNSKQRSKAFMIVLKKRLPKGWVLKATDVEDIQAVLRAREKSPPTLDDQEQTRKSQELMALPEIQEHMAKINEGHWREWPLTPLPALKGQSPVEAIKTSDGRASVDALITQFERDAERKPMPGQTVDTFRRLRERLGL